MRLFSPDLGKVLANTASQLSVRLLTSITTLLVTLIISYQMGLTSYGSFTKVVAFVTFFYLFVDFGMNAVFLREHYEDIKRYSFSLLGSRLLTSLFIVLAINVITIFLPYNSVLNTGYSSQEKFLIFLFSFTIILYGLQLSLQAIMQRYLEYNKQILPSIVSSVILLGFVWFGAQQKDLVSIFVGYILATGIQTVFLYKLLKNHIAKAVDFGEIIPFTKALLKFSSPLALVLIFNLIYAKVDMILLSIYSPSFEVGVYGFAYRIFELAIAVPLLFSNSVYPYLLEHSSDRTKFLALIKYYSALLFVASIALGLVIYIGSSFLPLIQEDFVNSIVPLRILLVSLPLFFLTSLFQWILIVKNRMKGLIAIYFSVMVIVVVLNMIFIPRFSYYAAAVITVVGEGFVLLLLGSYFVIRREKII